MSGSFSFSSSFFKKRSVYNRAVMCYIEYGENQLRNVPALYRPENN